MKPSELLDSPDRWCQGNSALDAKGNHVCPNSTSASRWCIVGAIHKCLPGEENAGTRLDCYNSLCGVAIRTLGTSFYIDWQDKPGRLFEEVQALLKEAGL